MIIIGVHDLILANNTLDSTVISPGASKACLLLLAVDDEIVEDNELFTVTVETENPRDTVNGNASIIVSDNDGENSNNIVYNNSFFVSLCY